MLDAYTRTMCQKSWGRNTYARVLIEVSALTPLMESVVVVIPYPDGSGHSLEMVDVEYEWQPPLPRCESCKILDHVDTDCPKRAKVADNSVEKDDDGFMKVTRKNGKGKQDGKAKQEASSSKHDELIDSYDQLISTPTCTKDTSTDPLDDNEEEVEDVYIEPDPNISKQPRTNENKGASNPYDAVIYDNNLCLCVILESHVANSNLQVMCSKFCKHWYWTSNGLSCVKGSMIILGWNPNIVNVVGISYDAHVCIRDFNVSLSVDDKSTSTSYIDIGMRHFQECVEDLELSDVNSTGLRFTWNQKPKGGDDLVSNSWKTSVSGFWMFKVVKRLKLLKKPLCKLLYDHRKFHENVKRLRHELDEAQNVETRREG
ncbi:hypothetical protein Tco_1482616 [Tanacetum coccineum]